MIVIIGDFECTEVWDGVFYKKLSNINFLVGTLKHIYTIKC